MNRKKYSIALFALAVAAVLTLSGCTSIALTCEDRSRQTLAKCNTDCGEGILSEVCKTGCTIDNNQRLAQCQQSK